MSQIVDFPSLIRGDRWSKVVTGTIEDFDWTGVTAACQLRAKDGRLVCDLAADSHIAITFDGDTFTVLMDVPGSVTAGWLGTLWGEVELARTSPEWGPYSIARFRLEVLRDHTR